MSFPFSKPFGGCLVALYIAKSFKIQLLHNNFLSPISQHCLPLSPSLLTPLNVQSSNKTYIGPL